jgi:hypothetical protein
MHHSYAPLCRKTDRTAAKIFLLLEGDAGGESYHTTRCKKSIIIVVTSNRGLAELHNAIKKKLKSF